MKAQRGRVGWGHGHTRPWHWGRSRHLRGQLFIWLAVTIVVTAVTVGLVFRVAAIGQGAWGWDKDAARELIAQRFERAWDEPTDREQFASSLSHLLNAGVKLTSASGEPLLQSGSTCRHGIVGVPVRRGNELLGSVELCFEEGRGRVASIGLIALGVALLVLWGAAAVAARKITRPLSQLIAVTREMGAGNLAARVRLGRHGGGELKVLADSVNDMGRRIERQLKEQRELLAVVSHEVRSPLARIRVCTELLRGERGGESKALDTLEREVAEVDTLLGKLLAHSRLDFEALSKTPVVARQLFEYALQRHGLAETLLENEVAEQVIEVDVTLLARALDNLLDNVERHGAAPVQCTLRRARPGEEVQGQPAVVFLVHDRGKGFAQAALPKVFDPFYRTGEAGGAAAAGLGLGLSLVKRIALAHGGNAWASNRADGGASVAFSVALEVTA